MRKTSEVLARLCGYKNVHMLVRVFAARTALSNDGSVINTNMLLFMSSLKKKLKHVHIHVLNSANWPTHEILLLIASASSEESDAQSHMSFPFLNTLIWKKT